MATDPASLHIIIPVVVGIIVGVAEAYFVYEDENMTSGKQFLGDMWHGLIFSVIGVLAASNFPFILSMFELPSFLSNILMIDDVGRSIVISALIAIIMLTKMVASHAVKGVSGNGFKEKFWHKLVVALLVGFAPYYIFALYNIEFFKNLKDALPWLPL